MALALIGVGLCASIGGAARVVAPVNTAPPTVTGSPGEGEKLVGSRGSWSVTVTDYNDSRSAPRSS